MNNKLLLTSTLLLGFSPLATQACPVIKDPDILQYSRRDNNRCEGIKDRNASSIAGLTSFSTGLTSLSSYPSILNIRIPSKGQDLPTIEVQSFVKNYRLDDLALKSSRKGFLFHLNTRILSRADVPPESLLALAFVIRDSYTVYFPVVLGKATGQYEFVIKSNSRVSLPTFEIRRNNTTLYKAPQTIADSTHTLTWKYGNAQLGTYQLYLKDNQGTSQAIWFEHNPNLL